MLHITFKFLTLCKVRVFAGEKENLWLVNCLASTLRGMDRTSKYPCKWNIHFSRDVEFSLTAGEWKKKRVIALYSSTGDQTSFLSRLPAFTRRSSVAVAITIALYFSRRVLLKTRAERTCSLKNDAAWPEKNAEFRFWRSISVRFGRECGYGVRG